MENELKGPLGECAKKLVHSSSPERGVWNLRLEKNTFYLVKTLSQYSDKQFLWLSHFTKRFLKACQRNHISPEI